MLNPFLYSRYPALSDHRILWRAHFLHYHGDTAEHLLLLCLLLLLQEIDRVPPEQEEMDADPLIHFDCWTLHRARWNYYDFHRRVALHQPGRSDLHTANFYHTEEWRLPHGLCVPLHSDFDL